MLDPQAVWRALEDVKDPEIPAISVVELGMVRDVLVDETGTTIALAPTFAGCPAQDLISAQVAERVQSLGAEQVDVKIVLNPPWTTDWITETGRQKLRAFGLAPPPRHDGLIQVILADEAACPYCESTDTTLKNSFGPTLCRAIYYCNACRQPFEQFKAL